MIVMRLVGDSAMIQTEFTDRQWALIDEALFNNNPLLAIKLIRKEHGGLGLHQAGDIMHSRYKKLRDESPDRFRAMVAYSSRLETSMLQTSLPDFLMFSDSPA
jgi:hypothetical protein